MPGSASGVFVRLVPAQVFKTCGGREQRSQWIRFPSTPVFLPYERFTSLVTEANLDEKEGSQASWPPDGPV